MRAEILIPSLLLGIICTLIYGYKCYNTKRKFEAGKVVGIMLLSGGVIWGFVFIISGVYMEDLSILKKSRVYVYASGAAIVFFCSKSLLKDVHPEFHERMFGVWQGNG